MTATMRKILLLLVLPAVIIGGIFYLQFRSSQMSRQEVDSFIQANLPHMAVNYDKVSSNLFTGMNTITNLKLDVTADNRQQSILVDALSYHKAADSNGALERLRFDVTNMRLPLNKTNMEPALKEFYDNLKMQELNVNMHFDYHYNPKTHILEVQAKPEVPGLADLSASLQLVDYDPSKFTLTTLMDSKIKFFQCNYQDHSLVPHALDMFAKQAGKSREDFIKDVQARLQGRLEANESVHPFERLMAQNLLKFVSNPTTIAVTLRPQQPVTIGQLFGAKTTEELEGMGLKIQLN